MYSFIINKHQYLYLKYLILINKQFFNCIFYLNIYNTIFLSYNNKDFNYWIKKNYLYNDNVDYIKIE